MSLAAVIALVSLSRSAAAQPPTYVLQLSPQDTSLNVDAVNYSAQPLLTAYTWPDNKIANAILLKFDLSSLPAGAVVQQAVVSLALVESDATADATYTMTALKMVGMNPVIAAATGYTSNGATAWTPNACCYNGVPLAQADVSAAYASLAVDKAAGFKIWTITTMVLEWIASPASNAGLVLNSDATKLRDRYRYFASMEHADTALRPVLRITYSLSDTTPPTITAVAASSITGSAASIGWSTDEASDSQVEYGLTGAYGASTGVNATLVIGHTLPLTGLSDGRLYHYRVRSRDAASNLGVSGDVTFTTPDVTAPAVAVSAPAAGTIVTGVVVVSATATDNVAVASVQFRLDGVNLGAKDTVAPYTISWNTTTATVGAHTLRAIAKDAAGNSRTSAAVGVTVSNDATPPVISGIATTAITPTTATVGWTTDEGSDSQVDYGPTAAYGSTSPLNATAVTAHSVPLSSLTATTTYHARVRSRDAAGNLAVSGDFTFATTAVVPPPPPPPPSGWPHEPAGFATWASSALDTFSGNGWDIVNPSGLAAVVPGTGGSLTPAQVGQWTYPNGYFGGYSPATMYHNLPPGFDEGFAAVMWKPSNPWQGHPTHVNKIFFLLGGPCGNLIPIMYGPPGGPYQLRVAPEWGNWNWLIPNVNDIPIALGSWHRIELYFKYNTPGTGVIRWWMDGTLIGDYTNVTFPASGCFAEFQLAPTWGGAGGQKTQTDYFWFDDAYVSRPGSAPPPPPPGTTLFQEGFDDANLAGRGWYDNTTPLLSTTQHVANSVSSIQYTFNQGATTPTAGSAVRKKFTPTDAAYLGYWVKYSTNWVGSQQPYHPHEFQLLTTADGDWSGLSFNPLATYIEQNGGTPLIGIQDGSNIDQASIGVDLTFVSENRGVAGCNGSSDGYPDNCYFNGSTYVNEKKWRAPAQYFTDTPGASYKGDWHFVEAFVKMNSIAGGQGTNDGVVQYWFDGQLVIDRHDVLLRTGANATMQFNQLVIAPYIGDGSPVTQTLWIDSLSVGTIRP